MCGKVNIDINRHKNRTPQAIVELKLEESELKRIFNERTSGGLLSGNHWTFGQKLVGRKITIGIDGANKREILDTSNIMEIMTPKQFSSFRKQFEQLITNKSHPYSLIEYIRLRAERDIVPESEDTAFTEKGDGTTTIVKSFITKAALQSSLVENNMLEELNSIVHPDLNFSDILVQETDTGEWEIFLEEKDKGRIALSQSGSGLKTILLVLVIVLLKPNQINRSLENFVFAFEELENNLHPGIQRKLLYFLRDIAITEKTHMFITTHSNEVIDMFSNDTEAQIIHVKHDGDIASVSQVQAYIHERDVLDDLDVRASDLLQSNGIIWVEGPSDRIYVNKWIELFSDKTLMEGKHYQCMFYGGRLLSHLTAITDIESEEFQELIRILLINKNSVILLDSDKSNNKKHINATKKRILKEFQEIESLCWITKGKEIENYLPKEAISTYLNVVVENPIDPYKDFSEYLDTLKPGEGTKFKAKKVLFAEKISPHILREDMDNILDLKERIGQVINYIREWNGLNL
jgi:AAA ATPase domain